MQKKSKGATKGKKTLSDYYLIIICFLSLIILFGAIAFFSVSKPSKTLPDNTSNTTQQNILVNKILVNTEIKPDHHVYYILQKPANITGDFKIYAHLTSEDSFDFYIFEKKEDVSDSSKKPVNTMLLMKNLDRTFPVEEGNVMVLVNSRDKNVNVKGFVEYLER